MFYGLETSVTRDFAEYIFVKLFRLQRENRNILNWIFNPPMQSIRLLSEEKKYVYKNNSS